MPLDFDAHEDGGTPFDFDAMTDEQFNDLLIEVPNGNDLLLRVNALAKDAEAEVQLRGLVAKAIEAGFKAAKGGGVLSLLGLV